MSEFEKEPSPEDLERERLLRVIREHLPEDEEHLLEAHPDVDDLRMAIDGSLLAEGFDPDEIFSDSGEYEEVRYKAQGVGDQDEV